MQQHQEKLEGRMADVNSKLPKIPENGRKALVEWMPWIALVFGILQVWAAWSLWRLSERADELIDTLNQVARRFGVADTAPDLNFFYWLALILLAASGVMMLLAYPGLRDRKKAGWNWLFYAEILGLVYGVFALFFDGYYGGGVGRFLWALISAAIGFWLLFQVRDHYKN